MLGQARSVYILFFLITYVIRLREPPCFMTHSHCMVKSNTFRSYRFFNLSFCYANI